jgi:uncharacterized iron-regulated protein
MRVPSQWFSVVRGQLFLPVALGLLWGMLVSCETGPDVVEPAETHAGRVDYQPGLILSSREGKVVQFEDLLADLAQQDVVYVGEEHYNPHHVRAAMQILEELLSRNRQPVVGMEMFSWDGQAALSQYVQDRTYNRATFLKESRWEQNWGGDFENYEPLLAFAQRHARPVLALNPPRALVRQVAKVGWTKARELPDMEQWNMNGEAFPDDPPYRERIIGQLRLCHGGGTDSSYQGMFEASLFRDEGMAKTVTGGLRTYQIHQGSEAGPIVSYTGGGHIQYHLPVPNRVSRRGPEELKQVSIYLVAYDASRQTEIEELLRDRVADYVWLTATGPHGLPQRCGK